ncbi:DNA-binding transcriptional regulator, FadR family [Devosia enhydra]|uniref:DNA-binding transcriptional regulator, FadR family n=1 Tax=Devosia enhydra TaxID=665118 RepID=A0A1K2HZG5_9HYPH|nr:FCD domain-containing protein [Devosia enhydra]SFZ85472.1 DNA-binding transcriptional regulator, FadR family [Devosia enhydra]
MRLVADGAPKSAPGAPEIAALLAEEIHGGLFEAGAMLPPERDLCERFGVGRTAIREAIKRLETMRLVELRKGFRPRVVYPTLTQLLGSISAASRLFFRGTEGGAHMEQARLFLETSLVRYAAEAATPAQIGKMVAAIERGDRAINDLPAFRLTDVDFHRALAEVPGNPIFVALHDAFVGGLMMTRPGPRDVTSHNRRSNDEHKGVVQAIIAKDADAAVTILTKHLTRNYAVYVNQVLTPQGDGREGAEV